MSFITGLLGIKVPAWVYEIIAGILIAAFVTLYLEHRGAREELAKLQASSVQVKQDAQDEIDRNNQQHAAEVETNDLKTADLVATARNLAKSLDDSVRQFDAYRSAHRTMESTGGGSPATGPGECGNQSCGDLASQSLQDSDQLAGSDAELVAALQGCQRERDSLTGLPK